MTTGRIFAEPIYAADPVDLMQNVAMRAISGHQTLDVESRGCFSIIAVKLPD